MENFVQLSPFIGYEFTLRKTRIRTFAVILDLQRTPGSVQ